VNAVMPVEARRFLYGRDSWLKETGPQEGVLVEWEAEIIMDVRGDPKGQPRPRLCAAGEHVRVYTPRSAKGWKDAVYMAAWRQGIKQPIPGPIRVSMVFFFERPGRLTTNGSPGGSVAHMAKPDIDNIVKATLDALTDAGIWKDDAHVSMIYAEKVYCPKGGNSGALIQVFRQKKEPSGADDLKRKNSLPRAAK
jgi:Holliday junction resolvase RusA-like endonuclease